MADIVHDPRLIDQELHAHQRSFERFSRLVLFAILHVGLVLACLALAFLGDLPVLAALLAAGGTFALLVVFAPTS